MAETVDYSLMERLAAAKHRRAENEMILLRMFGLPAQPGTPETDADPNNPNNHLAEG